MKKYFILIFTISTLIIAGCDSDTDPGGTAVEKMAGDWWITISVIDNGQDLGDIFGVGHILNYTYNTAANTSDEMWIEDGGDFWDYKLKLNVDYAARTFSTTDFVPNTAYESKVKITDGKILENAAKTPSGMPADSIVYMVQFDDDTDGYTYKVSGFRRTGFPEDDF